MAYGSLPGFEDYLQSAQNAPAPAPVAPAPAPAPQATGTGNWFTAGLGSGFHGALASAAGLGEAGARLVGADDLADSAAGYADSERAAAQTYARPDLENANWYDPTALGYRLSQSLPALGVGLAGAAVGALAAPEEGAAALMTGVGGVIARNAGLIGGAAATYPLAVGENVQRAKDYYGKLDQGSAAKALALGVPEAIAQGILPGKLEGMIGEAAGKGILKTARDSAITQAGAGAATEFLTQMMGDPNRPMAQRSHDIIDAALQGGVLGGVTAGVLHPITSAAHAVLNTPVQNITDNALFNYIRLKMDPVQPSVLPPSPMSEPRPLPGSQPTLPGIADEYQARPPVDTTGLQGQLPFPAAPGGPEPVQGQLNLRGGYGQPDLFSGVFPPAPDFTTGERQGPSQELSRRRVNYQPSLFDREQLPFQVPPTRDVAEGVQGQLDLRGEPEAEHQQELPLSPVAHQFDLFGTRPIGEAGGFDQGAIPHQTMGYPEEQRHLTLEEAQARAHSNDNLPPNDQPPAAQQDLGARLRDPTDPLFKAVGGVNENERTREGGPVREATPQPELPLAKPGEAPVGNEPTLTGKVTPQEDVTGPITTQEGLRKAGLSPVEVGKEVANAPANKNVEGPGATREAVAQGDVVQPAEKIAPANDKFDQSTIQADLNKLPDLRKSQFATTDEAQKAVAQAVVTREAAGRAAPPALERVAKALGVIKDDGSIDPKFTQEEPLAGPAEKPEGPVERVQAGPQVPEPGPRPNTPGGGKRYDDLQALRDQLLGDNLTDDHKFELVKKITSLQDELSVGVKGSSRTSGIVRETREVAEQVRAREAAKAAPVAEDPTALAHTTQPSPQAQAFIAEATKPATEQVLKGEAARKFNKDGQPEPKPKAAKAKKAVKALPDNIPEVNSAEPARDAMLSEGGRDNEGPGPIPEKPTQEAARKAAPEPKPATQEAARKAARTKKVPEPKAEDISPPPVEAAIQDVQENTPTDQPKPATSDKLAQRQAKANTSPEAKARTEANKRAKRESQTVQAVDAVLKNQEKKVVPATPLTPEITSLMQQARAALEALKQNPTKNVRRLDAFNKGIAKHEQQMAVLEKAATEGGLEALQNFRRDHFEDDLYAGFEGNLGPTGNAALEAHANAETNLMDAIAGLRGERPLIRYEAQPTQYDVNLTNVIGSTNELSDALAYVKQNDPSPFLRMMANVLEKFGLDTSIKMASDEEFLNDTTRKLGEGEVVAGSHNDALNRINIYDGSKVSQTVIHEAIHAATVRAIKAGTAAARELGAIFDRLKAKYGDSKLYGLSSSEEMVAEASSNEHFAQFLKSEPWQVNGIKDVWQAFKNAVFKTLGMPENMRSAFDQVMDTTNKLMGENSTKAAVTGERAMIANKGVKDFGDAIDKLGNHSLSMLSREAQGVASNLREGTRGGILGWVGTLDLAKTYTNLGSMMRVARAIDHTGNRGDTLSKPEVAAMHMAHGLSKEAITTINRASARDTLLGMTSTKSWAENAHLKGHANEAYLKAQHAEGQKDMDRLRRLDGGKAMKAYEAMRDANYFKASMRNVHLQQEYMRDYAPQLEGKPGFATDAVDDFERNYALHDNPTAAMNAMRAVEAQQRETLKAHQTDLLKAKTDTAKAFNDNEKLKTSDDPAVRASRLTGDIRQDMKDKMARARVEHSQLNGVLNDVDNLNKRGKEAPWFHIGRDDGQHFVSAHIATDINGVPKPAAFKALGDMLESKFKNVKAMEGTGSDKFYVRLNSQSERNLMFKEMQKLKDAGHLSDKHPIKQGLAIDDIFKSIAPEHMQRIVQAAIDNRPSIPEGTSPAQATKIIQAHIEHVQDLKRSLAELIPQNSLASLYQHRQGASGFDHDMIKAFRTAGVSNSRGLANLTMARESGAAMKAMRDEIKAMQMDPNVNPTTLTSTTQAAAEVMARSQGIRTYASASMMDAVRHLGHIFSVGMSPAYTMMLMGQVATNSLPELGAVHGHVRAAAALANATGHTFNMVKAVATGPDRATFGVRQEVLDGAKLDKAKVAFDMDMARRGIYSQGFSEAMQGHEADSLWGKTRQYASMMGRYSEMVPRVQLAHAARDLFMQDMKAGKAVVSHGIEFKTAEDYAAHVVEEAQLNWNNQLNARQLTRGGTFGVMSPMINQFMGFQTRMTAKLYREVHGALGGDRQSQKWLLGHAAAVATLAGTLGLPMVSVAASVYDKLADWATNQDDHDVIASYRSFLASTFGKEVGEVIARGAPRAIGLDMDHSGEGTIAPGSTALMMLTEKRKLEDAQKDWLKAEAGHSVGFLFHIATAVRDLSNHDYLEASEKLLPELFKSPIEAYRLAERNFVDKNGQRLPINATTTDIMMTAMGLDPAKEAEYEEEQKVQSGLQAMRQARSQNITRHLLLAQGRSDPQMFQQWEQEATQFQLDHPGMSGPLQDFGRSLSQHMRNAAVARGFGTPTGVNPRDIIGRGMTSFGNLRNSGT